MKNNRIVPILFIIGGVLTLTGAVLKVTDYLYSPYVFATGAALMVFCHTMIAIKTKDEDFRLRRITRLGFISSLFLVVAAYQMFTGANSWVAFLLIYALVTLFLSFRSGK